MSRAREQALRNRLGSTPRGQWSDGRYVPEPSVQAYEVFLARVIAARPCAGCMLPIGAGPIRASGGRSYHPACAPRGGAA